MSLFQQWMAPHPAPVSIEDQHTHDRSTVHQQVRQLASALTVHGIQPGNRVALVFFNQQAFLTSFLALWQIGAVIVPINLQLPPDDMAYVLQHASIRLLLADASLTERLNGLPWPCWESNGQDGLWDQQLNSSAEQQAVADVPVDALRLLIYTSGTTGRPKGVMLSEANLAANLAGIMPVFAFSEHDLVLHALPMFHAFGLILALLCLQQGAPMLLTPRFTPQALLKALLSHPVTVLPLIPTLFGLLVHGLRQAGSQPDTLKFCVSGGATLPVSLLKQVEAALGCPVLEGYGLTETSPVISVNRPQDGSRPGSVGRPLDNVTVRIRSEAGDWVDNADTIGEICVQGGNVMIGYYQLPDETRSAFTSDGFLRTGDLGHLDTDGFLYISAGRIKDLIIKAGENLSPVRIEQVLHELPEVMEACVFGVPDPLVGEEVMAAIVLRSPTSESLIRQHCRERLPAAMVPRQIKIVESLPKNAVGKVQRSVLTNTYATPQAASP